MKTNRLAAMVLLAAALSVLSGGCDIGDDGGPTAPSTAPATQEVTTAPVSPATAPAGGGEASADPANDPSLAALALELPRPNFVGTPKQVPPGVRLENAPENRPAFYAPVGARNVALGKPVKISDPMPLAGSAELVTDGDKEAVDGAYLEMSHGTQWVQIDLGGPHDIYAIVVWHFHMNARVYYGVIVQVSDEPDFIEARTIFNNDADGSSGLGVGEDYGFFDSYEGKLIDAKGIRARYVRLYSRGNTADEQNHYTEVEVWGLPAQ